MGQAVRIVDDAGVVHNVILIRIVVDGIVRTVAAKYVSDQGVVRQVWPPA